MSHTVRVILYYNLDKYLNNQTSDSTKWILNVSLIVLVTSQYFTSNHSAIIDCKVQARNSYLLLREE